jgi:hypothetical protein
MFPLIEETFPGVFHDRLAIRIVGLVESHLS